METADLYIRVSTDEQADKGYSQRDQEERLHKYCDQHGIRVRHVVFEDHSAKSFNRPAWLKLLQDLKKQKGRTDLVLFTKWDRFSRNAGDAYQMISTLRRLGVEPQAIEQPLDLSVPENKMMLAFYLAAPEVENDRRALNVLRGMRKAKKEGRWMGAAPIGYKNKTTESGVKYIGPVEPAASIVRWAFEELASGRFNTEQVWKMAREKGLKCQKNNFWLFIRNPVYCGKIFIAKYKDEESCFVRGLHEPLISEDLFNQVQDVLDGRGRHYRPKADTECEFPLRGFLLCPVCGKLLTASKSKGRHAYYAYYHCQKGCPHRMKAEPVHLTFHHELKKFIPRQEFHSLYRELLREAFYGQTKEQVDERQAVLRQIKDFEKRITHARDLVATEQIEPEDFREMKAAYTANIEKLEAKLSRLAQETDVEGLFRKGLDRLMRLDVCYEMSNTREKRMIIGSIFPEKLVIEENKVRTARVNEVAQLIYLINRQLGGQKKWTKGKNSLLSSKVHPREIEPGSGCVLICFKRRLFQMLD
ncbi:MAG: recombinase family protein [Hymenobacteraceae bacterium]|nr:recombinase family protein [Hymenobacteraceae bacterium]